MRYTILTLAGVEMKFWHGDGSLSLVYGTALVEVSSITLSCGTVLDSEQLLDLCFNKDNRN